MFLSFFDTLLFFTLEELATAALVPFSDRRRTAPLAVPGQFRLSTRAMTDRKSTKPFCGRFSSTDNF
jgi:hypothetical protein